MSLAKRLNSRPAYQIPCGNAVIFHDADDPSRDAVVCLKADRQGKEYVHHYLVRLDDLGSETMRLIYVDPEHQLVDSGLKVSFNVEGGREDTKANVGEVIVNESGTFLKMFDDPKTQKYFGFVDVIGHTVRVRQERKIKTVHDTWTVEIVHEDGSVTVAELHDAHMENC